MSYSFAAGPARLPETVLAQARETLFSRGADGAAPVERPFSAPQFRAVLAQAGPAVGQASAFRLAWRAPAAAPGQGAPQLALQARVVDGSGRLRYISTEHVAAAPGARIRLQRVG